MNIYSRFKVMYTVEVAGRLSSKVAREKVSSQSANPQPVGFTLIELLVTIAIIGILAAVGIPGLYGIYAHQQITSSASQISSAMSTARSNALSNNQAEFATNPPLSDCDASHAYISAYQVAIVDTKNFSLKRQFRQHPLDGDDSIDCQIPTKSVVATTRLTGGVSFSAADVGKVLAFNNIVGTMDPDNFYVELSNSALLGGSIKYCVYANHNKFYVKNESCPTS